MAGKRLERKVELSEIEPRAFGLSCQCSKELYNTTDSSATTELLDNLELVQTFTDIEQVSVSLEIIQKAIA